VAAVSEAKKKKKKGKEQGQTPVRARSEETPVKELELEQRQRKKAREQTPDEGEIWEGRCVAEAIHLALDYAGYLSPNIAKFSSSCRRKSRMCRCNDASRRHNDGTTKTHRLSQIIIV